MPWELESLLEEAKRLNDAKRLNIVCWQRSNTLTWNAGAAEAPQSEKWEPERLGLRGNNEEPTWKTSSHCTGDGQGRAKVIWGRLALVMYGDVYLWRVQILYFAW